MYRISTFMMHDNAGRSIQTQSGLLAQLQNQISSGKKINQPSDDPVGAVKLLDLQRQQGESDQFAKNISAAVNRSTLEEAALSDAASALQHARTLMVQGGNLGALSTSDRQSIANNLQSQLTELQDIANRKDSNGEYLFAGFSSLTQPFVRNGVNVTQYQGDSGSRLLQVGPSQWIADGHPGDEVFSTIPQGNGTFYTTATTTNGGSGVIDVGAVTDRAAWVPDNYTLTFTSATAWQITDSGSNVVSSGAYTDGTQIAFNGVQVKVTGTPASGDSFSINQSQKQDVFKMMDDLIAALKLPASNSATNARIATAVGYGLQQMDQVMDHWSQVRSQVGARLNALDTAETSRQSTSDELARTALQLQDLDYATAMTQYSARQVALQAAQLSYSQIAKLSLFNYL